MNTPTKTEDPAKVAADNALAVADQLERFAVNIREGRYILAAADLSFTVPNDLSTGTEDELAWPLPDPARARLSVECII